MEITSRVVFGKEAKDLSIAEQFVLASAVNKPIILLPGSDKLNEVRLDRWRYITEVRARICAEKLIASEAEQRRDHLRARQPCGRTARTARVKPKLQAALEAYAPALAQRALANPIIRANALMPAARFGVREEMKQAYGFGWREHVRAASPPPSTWWRTSASTSGSRLRLPSSQPALYQAKIDAGYTLDPAKALAPIMPSAGCPT